MRELKTSREAARREKPLVTLDLNLTFMQMPGSGSDPQARIGNTEIARNWVKCVKMKYFSHGAF